MKEKVTHYRPAAAAFLVMMAMALTSSTLSFFLTPVCAYLNVGRGSFSLIFSMMTVSGALMNPILGQFAGKKGVRGILILSAFWVCGAMILFSMAQQLWMIYAAGFLMGALATNCVSLCANVIVQQSYEGGEASSILGTVMAGSGVGGMIFSIVIPRVMEAVNWQRAMQVMGFCWLGLLLTASVLLPRERLPEQRRNGPSVGLGMTREEALRSPKLYLQFALVIILTACCGFQQQQPSLLNLYGFDTGTVSMMISMQTAVLALGKIGQGMLYGRLGIRRGGQVMLGVFALGFLVMLSRSLVYPGLVLMALGFGVYTTLMPQVVRRVFGSREYAAIYGIVAMAGSVGTIAANPLWGMVYDMTGSYTLGLLAAPVLLVGAIVVLSKLLQEKW